METEPREINKREQKFCTQLGKWWDNVGAKKFYPDNLKIEAKVGIGNKPFNFKGGIKKHQLPTLSLYKTKPHHWKISDIDTISTKHYDMSCDQPKHTRAMIAIMWVRDRNKKFYLIEPEDIQSLIDSGIKSLDEGMANVIAYLVDEVK